MGNQNGNMSIGEFSTATWLSPKALRLYERKGLLIPSQTDPFNGYRKYSPDQIDVARLITMLRRVDMSLEEIKNFLDAPPSERPKLIAHYRTTEAERHARRQALAKFVEHAVAGGSIEGAEQPDVARFEVSTRDVDDQFVLTSVQHTTARDLPAVIQDTAATLYAMAQNRGGTAGGLFVIYHGQVGWDSDGPIEVCLPVHAEHQAYRTEFAHRELFANVPGEDVQFPRILAVFEAVRVRATQLGLTPTAPPREVYIPLHPPNRFQCQVALPILNTTAEETHGNGTAR